MSIIEVCKWVKKRNHKEYPKELKVLSVSTLVYFHSGGLLRPMSVEFLSPGRQNTSSVFSQEI